MPTKTTLEEVLAVAVDLALEQGMAQDEFLRQAEYAAWRFLPPPPPRESPTYNEHVVWDLAQKHRTAKSKGLEFKVRQRAPVGDSDHFSMWFVGHVAQVIDVTITGHARDALIGGGGSWLHVESDIAAAVAKLEEHLTPHDT